MKLQIATVLVALIAVFSQHVDANLLEDLQEIQALVSTEEWMKLFEARMEYDVELQKFVKFLSTREYINAFKTMVNSKAYREVLLFLAQNNIVFPTPFVQNLKFEGLENMENLDNLEIMPRSYNDLVEEIFALLPKEEMTALMKSKMVTSKEFNNFINVVTSAEFKNVMYKFYNSAELAETFKTFELNGYDLKYVYSFSDEIFSWAK